MAEEETKGGVGCVMADARGLADTPQAAGEDGGGCREDNGQGGGSRPQCGRV